MILAKISSRDLVFGLLIRAHSHMHKMAEAAIVDEVQGDQVVPIKPAGGYKEVMVYI